MGSSFILPYFHRSEHIFIEKLKILGGDDKQALIWDLQSMPKAIEEPILAYAAEGEINQLNWSTSQPEWIAIAFTNKLQILRV